LLNNIITSNQSGFTFGDSAINQLVNISNDFGRALDSGKGIRVVLLVSSANNLMLALISVTISFMNNKNRRGPNIEPWGTPAFIVFHSEFDLFKTTRWDRPERYLSNHTKRLPNSQYCFVTPFIRTTILMM
jgi:hypothetical protein